jgi:sugar phosphate isomerase/epimerase
MARLGLATLNHSPLHDAPCTPWLEHLDAAAASGFDALAPDVFWLRQIEQAGPGLPALRRALDARGLGCMEIAGIAVGEAAKTRIELEMLRRMAGELGAEFMNTRITRPIDEALIDRARTVAESLAEVGTRVALEFSRGSVLGGVSQARALCDAIGVSGVGVTIDTWHFFLHPDGPDWKALDALEANQFATLQLSDGLPYEEGAFREATMDRRQFPGTGRFDLDRCLTALPVPLSGDACPIVVEVLNAEARRSSIADFADRAARSARTLLSRMSESPV